MAPHDRDPAADKCRCVYYGCFCCYEACDCNNPLCLCKGSEDFLCLRCSCCCAINTWVTNDAGNCVRLDAFVAILALPCPPSCAPVRGSSVAASRSPVSPVSPNTSPVPAS
eukprot:scaffold5944_cov101-Amphora_coffeaeformis.AAC.11